MNKKIIGYCVILFLFLCSDLSMYNGTNTTPLINKESITEDQIAPKASAVVTQMTDFSGEPINGLINSVPVTGNWFCRAEIGNREMVAEYNTLAQGVLGKLSPYGTEFNYVQVQYEWWHYSTDLSTGAENIFFNGNMQGCLFFCSGNLAYWDSVDSSKNRDNLGCQVQINQWNHYLLSFNGNAMTFTIYVNNQLIGTFQCSSASSSAFVVVHNPLTNTPATHLNYWDNFDASFIPDYYTNRNQARLKDTSFKDEPNFGSLSKIPHSTYWLTSTEIAGFKSSAAYLCFNVPESGWMKPYGNLRSRAYVTYEWWHYSTDLEECREMVHCFGTEGDGGELYFENNGKLNYYEYPGSELNRYLNVQVPKNTWNHYRVSLNGPSHNFDLWINNAFIGEFATHLDYSNHFVVNHRKWGSNQGMSFWNDFDANFLDGYYTNRNQGPRIIDFEHPTISLAQYTTCYGPWVYNAGFEGHSNVIKYDVINSGRTGFLKPFGAFSSRTNVEYEFQLWSSDLNFGRELIHFAGSIANGGGISFENDGANNGRILYYESGSSAHNQYLGGIIQRHSWTHIRISYDGSNSRFTIYINGNAFGPYATSYSYSDHFSIYHRYWNPETAGISYWDNFDSNLNNGYYTGRILNANFANDNDGDGLSNTQELQIGSNMCDMQSPRNSFETEIIGQPLSQTYWSQTSNVDVVGLTSWWNDISSGLKILRLNHQTNLRKQVSQNLENDPLYISFDFGLTSSWQLLASTIRLNLIDTNGNSHNIIDFGTQGGDNYIMNWNNYYHSIVASQTYEIELLISRKSIALWLDDEFLTSIEIDTITTPISAVQFSGYNANLIPTLNFYMDNLMITTPILIEESISTPVPVILTRLYDPLYTASGYQKLTVASSANLKIEIGAQTAAEIVSGKYTYQTSFTASTGAMTSNIQSPTSTSSEFCDKIVGKVIYLDYFTYRVYRPYKNERQMMVSEHNNLNLGELSLNPAEFESIFQMDDPDPKQNYASNGQHQTTPLLISDTPLFEKSYNIQISSGYEIEFKAKTSNPLLNKISIKLTYTNTVSYTIFNAIGGSQNMYSINVALPTNPLETTIYNTPLIWFGQYDPNT